MSDGIGVREIMAASAADAAGAGPASKPKVDRPLSGLAAEAAAAVRRRADAAVSPVSVSMGLRLVDALVVVCTGLLIALAYVEGGFPWDLYLPITLLAGLGTIVVFQLGGLYEMGTLRTLSRQLGRVALGWGSVLVLAVLALFLLKIGELYSRGWWLMWFIGGLGALAAVRLVTRHYVDLLIAAGRLTRRVVVVGGGQAARDFITAIEKGRDHDIEVVGVFDDRDESRVEPIEGYPRLGNMDDLVTFARIARVDMLIVTIPVSAESRLLEMLKTLAVLPVDVRLSAHANKLRFRPRAYSFVGDVPVFDMLDRPLTDWDQLQKRIIDRVLGGLLLIAFAPVMAAVAVAVKLDSPGPALFRQKRYGFNNELIEVFKFRSMYVDQSDAKAAKLVTKDDPRVTKVGRFIRKTSLDELPQLINVAIKGNLSLVGPRPHAVSAKAAGRVYDEVVDSYFARHKVRPGITGWAQINGWRGETDTDDKIQRRVEHDLYYIENWSAPLDLLILARTPLSLLKTENAY
ncbi:MAG: undecaprenyl-phosphate glucose phosphotransferase [Pseudomonadota bacterium]